MAVGIAMCLASVGAVGQMQAWEGTYQTNYGPLTFMRSGAQVLAQAPNFNGQLFMSNISPSVIGGDWVQTESKQRCARPLRGSYYWGHVQFRFPGNGTIQGQWGYCDQPISTPWNGRRG